MLIAVSLIAVIGALLLPTLGPSDTVRLIGASRQLASDVEFAQSLSLSGPEDPAVVVFDEAGARYWVARASDPATPVLVGVDEEPYVVQLGDNPDSIADGVGVFASGVAGGELGFDQFGALAARDDAWIELRNGSGSIYVAVRGTTGSVSVTDERPGPPVGG
jgi:hypothetical protein